MRIDGFILLEHAYVHVCLVLWAGFMQDLSSHFSFTFPHPSKFAASE